LLVSCFRAIEARRRNSCKCSRKSARKHFSLLAAIDPASHRDALFPLLTREVGLRAVLDGIASQYMGGSNFGTPAWRLAIHRDARLVGVCATCTESKSSEISESACSSHRHAKLPGFMSLSGAKVRRRCGQQSILECRPGFCACLHLPKPAKQFPVEPSDQNQYRPECR
jgi:hypothetical protein